MERLSPTRKRLRIEQYQNFSPPSSSIFQLTQSEITCSFQEAQAYFSEKETFQCPFCANHINHNYLQTHIKYCSNLFEQFYLPPTRKTVEKQALALYSHDHSPVSKHRIRCLIGGLKKEQAMDVFVTEALTRAGLKVKFANIKVPSAENFSQPCYKVRYINIVEKYEFEENYNFSTEANCYVELESTNDEETLFILHNTFNKNTITVLPKQKVETFIRPNFNWYPDIIPVILSYFQSPPENTKGFHQTNSYIQIFSNYYIKCTGNFKNWPFYFIKLAMQIENKYFTQIPLKWQLNKRIIIAALENKSSHAETIVNNIPSALQQDVDVLVAMSLINPNHFLKIPKEKIDKNFILHCLHYGVCSSIAQYIPIEFLNDGAFVLKLLLHDSEIIDYIPFSKISTDAFADEEITSQLLAIHGYLLGAAPNHVKKNRRLVLIAVRQNGHNLLKADESFLEDREVVLTAVQQSGSVLEFVSEKLKQDKQVVMTAIQNDHNALQFASSTLQQDKELIQLARKVEQRNKLLNRKDHN